MTDTEFKEELKNYISDLLVSEKEVLRTEFYIELQPGLITYGGQFIKTDEEVPLDIRQIDKSTRSYFTDKIEQFHIKSTNGGLNKWNKANYVIDRNGKIDGELFWDEKWERENIDSYKNQTDSRQKWYWEEK